MSRAIRIHGTNRSKHCREEGCKRQHYNAWSHALSSHLTRGQESSALLPFPRLLWGGLWLQAYFATMAFAMDIVYCQTGIAPVGPTRPQLPQPIDSAGAGQIRLTSRYTFKDADPVRHLRQRTPLCRRHNDVLGQRHMQQVEAESNLLDSCATWSNHHASE